MKILLIILTTKIDNLTFLHDCNLGQTTDIILDESAETSGEVVFREIQQLHRIR